MLSPQDQEKDIVLISFPFNIVLEVLIIAIRQENENHPDWKKEIKVFT